jgi:hypothetical protein
MQTVKRDLNRLLDQRERKTPLPTPAPAAGIAAQSGFGTPKPNRLQNPGVGGIASPVSEPDYAQRTYYEPEILTSTDGLFSFLVRRVESITMKDANGDEVVFNFANKPAP